MIFWLKRYAYMLPIIMLVASFVLAFIDLKNNQNYVVAGNILGYSLATDILFFLYFSTEKKYCILTRVSPIGLLLMNCVDIIGFYFYENFYNFWYIISINFIVFFLSILFYITKKIKK